VRIPVEPLRSGLGCDVSRVWLFSMHDGRYLCDVPLGELCSELVGWSQPGGRGRQESFSRAKSRETWNRGSLDYL
jgi:hypothetical protein